MMQAPPPRQFLLTRLRQGLVYAAGLGLWLSGAAWLLLHYFAVRQTEFGPAPHPFEHWSLAAHALFAFAAIWVFGMLWSAHVTGAWRTGRRRASGIATFAVMAVLIASGFLLYYVADDEARAAISLAHWIIGLALPIAFLWHRFFSYGTRFPRS